MDAATLWLSEHDPLDDDDWYDDDKPFGPKPVRTFCDGPYEDLGDGCFHRLPANDFCID